MLGPDEIMLSTADKEVFHALISGVPEGTTASVFHTRSVEFESVSHFVISFSSDVAVGVFAAWLYDRIKGRSTEKTTIDGRDVPRDVQQLTVVINNTLQQHQSQSQENHDKNH